MRGWLIGGGLRRTGPGAPLRRRPGRSVSRPPALGASEGAAARDRGPDLAAVRQFLDSDKSYSPAEKAAAQAALQRLTRKAPALDDAQFELAVAHIAAITDNGHTFLMPGAWPQRYDRIPLRLVLLSDGLFVGSADAADSDLVGARVVRIEGRALPALREAYRRYEGGLEGWRQQFLPYFLESADILHAASVARRADRLRMEFRLRDGARLTRDLAARREPTARTGIELLLPPDRLVELARGGRASMLPPALPLYLQDAQAPFRSAWMADGIYYLQLKFNSDFAGARMADFVARVRSELAQRRRRPSSSISASTSEETSTPHARSCRTCRT